MYCKFGDSSGVQTHNGLINCLYAIDYNEVSSFITEKPVEDQTKAYHIYNATKYNSIEEGKKTMYVRNDL